jgi:hypothetical protein
MCRPDAQGRWDIPPLRVCFAAHGISVGSNSALGSLFPEFLRKHDLQTACGHRVWQSASPIRGAPWCRCSLLGSAARRVRGAWGVGPRPLVACSQGQGGPQSSLALALLRLPKKHEQPSEKSPLLTGSGEYFSAHCCSLQITADHCCSEDELHEECLETESMSIRVTDLGRG